MGMGAPYRWVGDGFEPFLRLAFRFEDISVFEDHNL
jgi:hypothetical protein